MPDWVKRVEKERAGDLGGTPVTAACYYQGYGSASSQIAYGMAHGIARNVADLNLGTAQVFADRARQRAERRTAGADHKPPGSIAAGFPDAKGIVAVAGERLLTFRYKQGIFSTKIEELVVEVPLAQIEGWFYQSGSLASVLSLSFADESEIHLELPRANKPDAFADTLQIPRA